MRYLFLDLAYSYKICPFIVNLKGSQSKTGAHIFDVHLMNEMKSNTFAPRLHIVYLKCMLVSTAACAPANRALNKTSPGVVSFFIDRSTREFFFYENNFPD